jgi:hypothetical protein
MLEVSLGIIASCLPTLRGLTKNRSVDSLVNSIRAIKSGGASNKSDDSVQLTEVVKGSPGQGNEFITIAGHDHA